VASTKLHVDVAWIPDAVGVVTIVHGAGEHSGRYGELRGVLAREGFATATLDLRGHGLSPGARLDVESFDDYLEDLAGLRAIVDGRRGSLPHFLLGHSMGTLVALREATRRPEGLGGLALLSMPVRLSRAWMRLLAGAVPVISAIAPGFRLSMRIDAEDLTSDPAAQDEARKDRMRTTNGTARWGAAFRGAMRAAPAQAASVRLPFLALHGTDDAVADIGGARSLVASAGSSDKTFLAYEGARHELFFERPEIRTAVFRDLASWLRARASDRRG
jgi:alpha-beta hydrolase superfamily lysophospholipase